MIFVTGKHNPGDFSCTKPRSKVGVESERAVPGETRLRPRLPLTIIIARWDHAWLGLMK